MTSVPNAFPGLGPLESKVMAVIWASPTATVREVHSALNERRSVAYTTVMTTMDRLHHKGLLTRRREGTAYRYSPKIDRHGWLARWTRSVIDRLLPTLDATSVAYFVEEARKMNPELISELRRMIEERRRG